MSLQLIVICAAIFRGTVRVWVGEDKANRKVGALRAKIPVCCSPWHLSVHRSVRQIGGAQEVLDEGKAGPRNRMEKTVPAMRSNFLVPFLSRDVSVFGAHQVCELSSPLCCF